MSAYYNEIDPKAAAWLRELIKQGHIADGVVDERSIEDVRPQDLNGFIQCHFFAGIGVWSYALRRAGWCDDMPIWTGSCPCQPFSAAGKGGGFSDDRHLWPAFFHLIECLRPVIVMGEQVGKKNGFTWLDLIQTDLEGTDYNFGAVGMGAAGVGSPNIRERNYWVAYSNEGECGRLPNITKYINLRSEVERKQSDSQLKSRSEVRGLAYTNSNGRKYSSQVTGGDRERTYEGECGQQFSTVCNTSELGDAGGTGLEGHAWYGGNERRWAGTYGSITPPSILGGLADTSNNTRFESVARPIIGVDEKEFGTVQTEYGSSRPTNGFWRNVDWLFCRDGKWRPVEPGTFPLVNGASARVGRLRGYGNAINAEVATENIKALMEVLGICLSN